MMVMNPRSHGWLSSYLLHAGLQHLLGVPVVFVQLGGGSSVVILETHDLLLSFVVWMLDKHIGPLPLPIVKDL